ncbi:MAG: haloalkane dehalogenase [Acidobacteriota bacterium]
MATAISVYSSGSAKVFAQENISVSRDLANIKLRTTPSEFIKKKKFAKVFGSKMAYFESGKGNPIVFLHGNPTSSFLWRNVIPHVEEFGRCIAPDLIGMGDSDKLAPSDASRYHFAEHYNYLEELLRKIGVEKNVILMVHDWGGSLGFEWASRNPEKVKGLVFMETFIVSQNAQNTPPQVSNWFKAFRTPEREKQILEENYFVEKVLLRQFPKMSDEDKAEYRRPFLEKGEARRPTIVFPRQVPLDGEPKDVHEKVSAHLEWMAKNDIPKLFIKGEPGGLIQGGRERICRAWKNITEVSVKGNHYLPEESPVEVGQAIAEWVEKLSKKVEKV